LIGYPYLKKRTVGYFVISYFLQNAACASQSTLATATFPGSLCAKSVFFKAKIKKIISFKQYSNFQLFQKIDFFKIQFFEIRSVF
jgi:deoxycytidylate deaminase